VVEARVERAFARERKLRFRSGFGTALRAKRARAKPARSRTVGEGRQPCGAAMLRVAAAHQFAYA
jgi:hypothetical protein